MSEHHRISKHLNELLLDDAKTLSLVVLFEVTMMCSLSKLSSLTTHASEVDVLAGVVVLRVR